MLTETERMEIVSALGLGEGHWYVCPGGHTYCVGECGTPIEKLPCPQCGAVIGKTNGCKQTQHRDHEMDKCAVKLQKQNERMEKIEDKIIE